MRDEERRDEQHGRPGCGNDADENASVQEAPAHEPVAEEPAGQHPEHRADADEQEEHVRERLIDPVLLLYELGAERLEAGEEVVAARAGGDQDEVRSHAQHVPDRGREADVLAILGEHESGIGLDSTLARELMRVARPTVVRAARIDGRGIDVLEGRGPAARRLRKLDDEPREHERGKCEHDERRSP